MLDAIRTTAHEVRHLAQDGMETDLAEADALAYEERVEGRIRASIVA